MGAMDTAARNSSQLQTDNMDTSYRVLGERGRSRSVSHIMDAPTQLGVGRRARGEAPATTLAVDLAVAKEHAQWWASDLKPQMTALTHQMVAGSDEAVSV